MKRCFVLRKYILFRWGKKILNKAFGRNLPFCRTYVLGALRAFSVSLQGWRTSVLSRVFISVSWFSRFLVGGFRQEILVRFMAERQQVLCRFLIFVAVDFCFIRLFFRRLHRILVIFKYFFIYLCISVLSAFNYLKGCSLLPRVQWLRGGDTPGCLYVFLCHQLGGIRNEFRRIISSFHCSNFSVFYVHILGRLFALSFLLFMTLSTFFLQVLS